MTKEDTEIEKIKAGIAFALSMEVYEFFESVVSEKCMPKLLFHIKECSCVVCRAKELEKKLRNRYVELGWKIKPCKACGGDGIQK